MVTTGEQLPYQGQILVSNSPVSNSPVRYSPVSNSPVSNSPYPALTILAFLPFRLQIWHSDLPLFAVVRYMYVAQ